MLKRKIKTDRFRTDIDQLLIFFLLAVTVTQMGKYLATFAPPDMQWLGYLQAIAIDAAIWRSAWWFRKYRGKKQRRWALVGVLVFTSVSWAYNSAYYNSTGSIHVAQAVLMGAVLPVGVALLSYLYGQKDESAFGRKRGEESQGSAVDKTPEPLPATPVNLPRPGENKKDMILRLRRENSDMTQEEIAEVVGTTQGWVSTVIRGSNGQESRS
jgi:hypothetical protein